jgi:hypothetical protein
VKTVQFRQEKRERRELEVRNNVNKELVKLLSEERLQQFAEMKKYFELQLDATPNQEERLARFSEQLMQQEGEMRASAAAVTNIRVGRNKQLLTDLYKLGQVSFDALSSTYSHGDDGHHGDGYDPLDDDMLASSSASSSSQPMRLSTRRRQSASSRSSSSSSNTVSSSSTTTNTTNSSSKVTTMQTSMMAAGIAAGREAGMVGVMGQIDNNILAEKDALTNRIAELELEVAKLTVLNKEKLVRLKSVAHGSSKQAVQKHRHFQHQLKELLAVSKNYQVKVVEQQVQMRSIRAEKQALLSELEVLKSFDHKDDLRAHLQAEQAKGARALEAKRQEHLFKLKNENRELTARLKQISVDNESFQARAKSHEVTIDKLYQQSNRDRYAAKVTRQRLEAELKACKGQLRGGGGSGSSSGAAAGDDSAMLTDDPSEMVPADIVYDADGNEIDAQDAAALALANGGGSAPSSSSAAHVSIDAYRALQLENRDLTDRLDEAQGQLKHATSAAAANAQQLHGSSSSSSLASSSRRTLSSVTPDMEDDEVKLAALREEIKDDILTLEDDKREVEFVNKDLKEQVDAAQVERKDHTLVGTLRCWRCGGRPLCLCVRNCQVLVLRL